jgi:hypothetical protein
LRPDQSECPSLMVLVMQSHDAGKRFFVAAEQIELSLKIVI